MIFLFSVPGGEAVALEPFHYAIIGQTQFSGKTTLIKRLADWVAAQGYKVLIFDTKETEADYASFGSEVPVCLRETTDSFVLIGLLESMFKRRLRNTDSLSQLPIASSTVLHEFGNQLQLNVLHRLPFQNYVTGKLVGSANNTFWRGNMP